MTSSEQKLVIAPAAAADAEAMLLVQHAAFTIEAEIYGTTCIEPLRQDAEGLRLEMQGHQYLKASIDGKIVGMARSQVKDGVGLIGRLAVLPSLHGQGIGRALLQAAEAWCGPVARFELFTGAKSLRNIRMYQAAGYRIFKTQPGSPEMVFMEKLLS